MRAAEDRAFFPMRSCPSETTIQVDPTTTRRQHMRSINRPQRIAAAALALLAFTAPAATARPIIDRPIDDPDAPAPVTSVPAAGASFDWGSAGLGAAATAGLLLVAAGARLTPSARR